MIGLEIWTPEEWWSFALGEPPMIVRTPCAPSATDIARLLARARVPMAVETQAQAEVERLLIDAYGAVLVRREFRLSPKDRPDFFIAGSIVVELKGPRHRQADVQRQLERYVADPRVKAVILCTARAMGMPAELHAPGNSAPCLMVNLGRSWF